MSDQSDPTRPKAPPSPRRSFPSGNSSLLAVFILGFIAVWMLSGEIVVGGSDTDKVSPIAGQENNDRSQDSSIGADSIASDHTISQKDQAAAKTKKLFAVRAKLFTSRPRREVLHIRARSKADVSVEVRAETSGRVIKILGHKGDLVKQGKVLCKLDEGARQATLSQATARLEQTKSDYLAAAKLSKRGFSAKLNVNAKKAAYNGAMASLKKARIDLDYTSIRAPFTGIIEERSAKVGDFLSVLMAGKTCAKLVKLHPLLIVGDVSERNITKLTVGQNGRAELVTGEKVHGRIRFISPSAKVETRTFRVELEVDNKNLKMKNGVTSDIYVPLKTTIGHQISPAYLTLNDNGEVGVRSIGEGDIVKFLPVKILEQGKTGLWVSGLPKKIVIITTGNDYVVEGQKVQVVMDKQASLNQSSNDVQIHGASKHERS
ncbi:MAG: efflux RND transporter periplasmic adaptor subunit [bacterium]|nr:efflux RND transporter periplasmic adaptor subunit [bacterium]